MVLIDLDTQIARRQQRLNSCRILNLQENVVGFGDLLKVWFLRRTLEGSLTRG